MEDEKESLKLFFWIWIIGYVIFLSSWNSSNFGDICVKRVSYQFLYFCLKLGNIFEMKFQNSDLFSFVRSGGKTSSGSFKNAERVKKMINIFLNECFPHILSFLRCFNAILSTKELACPFIYTHRLLRLLGPQFGKCCTRICKSQGRKPAMWKLYCIQ